MASNLPAPPPNVGKRSMWAKIVRSDRREKRETAARRETATRVGGMITTSIVAIGGGFLWEKYPQVQRVGAGNGRAGIDGRLLVGVPLALISLRPRSPRWTKDAAETLLTTLLWDFGRSKA